MAVNDRSQFLQDRIFERELLRDLRAGEKKLKEKHLMYIPKLEGEDEQTYQLKVEGAYLYNCVELNIQKLSSKPFIKSPMIKSETNPIFFKDLEFDFDNNNHTLQEFGRTWMEDALWDSQSHVFVDYPQAEKDIDGSYIQNNEARPVAVILNNDNILHFRYSGKELSYLRFKDYINTPTEDGFDDVCLEIIKEFKKYNGKVYWNAYIQDGPDSIEYIKIYQEDQLFGLDYIPLVSFYPMSSRIPFAPRLIFQNMANIQKKHFSSMADKLNCEHVVTSPFLVIKGVEDGGQKGIEVSTFNAMFFTDKEASVSYVEHNGAALKTANETLIQMERQMESMGIDLMSRTSGGETATENAIDEANNNAMLSSMCVSLKEALEKVVDVYCDWMNIEKDFYLDITTKFNIRITESQQKYYDTALASNIISKKTYFDIGLNAGYLSTDLTYEQDQENINSDLDIGLNLSAINQSNEQKNEIIEEDI